MGGFYVYQFFFSSLNIERCKLSIEHFLHSSSFQLAIIFIFIKKLTKRLRNQIIAFNFATT